MTNGNRRRNIATEVARGREALESAEILFGAGKYADSVSRAYYAAFHHACALLLMIGEQARRHGGVERLMQRDLVRTGKLDPEVARLFSHLMKERHDADYGADFVFTETGAADQLEASRRFCARARELLDDGGWLLPA